MLKIQQYKKAETLEEAYELLSKNRNNQIIAGMLWLKMEDRIIPQAIDLELLHLDQIEEDDEKFTIGAGVTLRTLELHEQLNQWCGNVIRDSVKDIGRCAVPQPCDNRRKRLFTFRLFRCHLCFNESEM